MSETSNVRWPVAVEDQLRWGDMDSLGHVNNTVYFQFCENARLAYFQQLGLERFFELPTDGPGMVACTLNFRRQLHYPGRVQTMARVTSVGRKSFVLEYRIVDQSDGAIVADGSSVCLLVDYAAGRARTLAPGLIEALVAFEQNPQLRETLTQE